MDPTSRRGPSATVDNPAMQIHRGLHSLATLALAKGGTALTIGNFDGVHRGHQAMLALLRNEARHRGVPACVLTFEPHPRDFFARRAGKPELAPARIATLRDQVVELERCGIEHVIVLRFDNHLASLSPDDFIANVLVKGLGVRYVLVGDDFRFGAKRAGDYAMLDAAGSALGFDVARMMSYEVHGLRVSSSAVREALAAGDMPKAAALLGRPYSHAQPAHAGGAPRGLGHLRLARARADAGAPAGGVQPGRTAHHREGGTRAAGDALPGLARAAGPRGGLRQADQRRALEVAARGAQLRLAGGPAGRHRGRRGGGQRILRALRPWPGWILRLRAG
jgi:hypothetical protein